MRWDYYLRLGRIRGLVKSRKFRMSYPTARHLDSYTEKIVDALIKRCITKDSITIDVKDIDALFRPLLNPDTSILEILTTENEIVEEVRRELGRHPNGRFTPYPKKRVKSS